MIIMGIDENKRLTLMIYSYYLVLILVVVINQRAIKV